MLSVNPKPRQVANALDERRKLLSIDVSEALTSHALQVRMTVSHCLLDTMIPRRIGQLLRRREMKDRGTAGHMRVAHDASVDERLQ